MIGHWEIILLLLAVVLLFGSGRISSLMGDVAKGIKSFKKGLKDDDDGTGTPTKGSIENASSQSEGKDANKSNS